MFLFVSFLNQVVPTRHGGPEKLRENTDVQAIGAGGARLAEASETIRGTKTDSCDSTSVKTGTAGAMNVGTNGVSITALACQRQDAHWRSWVPPGWKMR